MANKTKISEQIRKANTANIIKKAKSGKVLSNKEIEAIEEYENEKEAAEINKDRIIQTTTQTALFFGVTTMTLTNWSRLGFPRVEKNAYDLKKCFDWWQENINEGASKRENDVRERYWCAKAEAEEIKIARIKGELIKRDDVFTEFAQRASDLKTGLRALKYRLSGLLVGKDQDEIMNILGVEIDSMLRNFCRQGKYIEYEETPAKKTVKSKKTTTKTKAKPKKKATAKKSTKKAVKK